MRGYPCTQREGYTTHPALNKVTLFFVTHSMSSHAYPGPALVSSLYYMSLNKYTKENKKIIKKGKSTMSLSKNWACTACAFQGISVRNKKILHTVSLMSDRGSWLNGHQLDPGPNWRDSQPIGPPRRYPDVPVWTEHKNYAAKLRAYRGPGMCHRLSWRETSQ